MVVLTKKTEKDPVQVKTESPKRKSSSARWHAHRSKFYQIEGMGRKERNFWAKISYDTQKQSISKMYKTAWKFRNDDKNTTDIDEIKRDLIKYVLPDHSVPSQVDGILQTVPDPAEVKLEGNEVE